MFVSKGLPHSNWLFSPIGPRSSRISRRSHLDGEKYVPRMERVRPPGGGGVERSKGPRSVRVRWPAEGSGRPLGGMEVKRRALLVDIFVVDGVWGVDWMTVWERWVDGGNSFVSVSVCGSRAFITSRHMDSFRHSVFTFLDFLLLIVNPREVTTAPDICQPPSRSRSSALLVVRA